MLPLGVLTRAHGIRGEIKLSTNLDPKYFSEVLRVVVLGKEYEVENLRKVSGGALIKFKGVDTPEEANTLRGTAYFSDICRPKLGDGEFFWDELKGAVCSLSDGSVLGKIVEIRLNVPTPVISVSIIDSNHEKTGKEVMFPVIRGLIEEVDTSGGRLILNKDIFGRVAVYED